MKRIAIIAVALALPGCMRALKPHAEDHYVQTQTMADACRGQAGALSYPEAPCSPDLQADLDAAAEKARAILAVTRGQKPSEVGQ